MMEIVSVSGQAQDSFEPLVKKIEPLSHVEVQ